MISLYHAANANYQVGEALVSLLTQIERGWISEDEAQAIIGRWDAGEDYLFADGAMVSLTSDLEQARAIRAEWNGGAGVILSVDGDALRDDGLLRRNAEGYPAVPQEIDPAYIIGVVP